ncbi:MAG: CTP synthase, partial [Bacteroidales bacterium]|nr:CTP synthase [Bacteroidales bacterium]
YEVPLPMLRERLDLEVLRKMGITSPQAPDLRSWEQFLDKLKNPRHTVRIGLVGKYVELKDAYKSILESLIHAGTVHQCKVDVVMIHSEEVEKQGVEHFLNSLDGIVVAPGFGERGIEGKIQSIRYARENKIPFLGICLGMQCAVVEFARNVLGLEGAHSKEMNPRTPHPVIDIMEAQKKISTKGGTMRLGAYPCRIVEGTRAHEVYGATMISERHRHRYEFNNRYLRDFQEAGMIPSGINPKEDLVEIMEIPEHPWFIGIQFHPEYRSTVANPHPLFAGLVKAALQYHDLRENSDQ